MNIIDHSASKLAKAIRRHDPNASSEAVLTYSLIIILNTLSCVFIVLITCLITGRFIEGILVLFFFAFLRYFSGGVHLNSSLTCTIASSVVLIIIAHIPLQYWWTGFTLDIISIIILLWLAPAGVESVSKLNPKYYPLLKVISIIIVSSNFLVQHPVLSLTFLTQAVTLFPLTYKLIDYIERR